MFCSVKDWRRIATRYDNLATNFAAAVGSPVDRRPAARRSGSIAGPRSRHHLVDLIESRPRAVVFPAAG
jgi:hypothetical protein